VWALREESKRRLEETAQRGFDVTHHPPSVIRMRWAGHVECTRRQETCSDFSWEYFRVNRRLEEPGFDVKINYMSLREMKWEGVKRIQLALINMATNNSGFEKNAGNSSTTL
jgi:hypothetical protein